MLKDVRNEFVSLQAAREEYGVVIDPESRQVDIAATETLRKEMRSGRAWTEAPFIDRGKLPEGVVITD